MFDLIMTDICACKHIGGLIDALIVDASSVDCYEWYECPINVNRDRNAERSDNTVAHPNIWNKYQCTRSFQ